MTLSTTSPGDERLPHADSVQQPSDSDIIKIAETLGKHEPGVSNYDSWGPLGYRLDEDGRYTIPVLPRNVLPFARALLARFARALNPAISHRAPTGQAMGEALKLAEEAIIAIEDWAGYASNHFKQKHGYETEMAGYRERLAALFRFGMRPAAEPSQSSSAGETWRRRAEHLDRELKAARVDVDSEIIEGQLKDFLLRFGGKYDGNGMWGVSLYLEDICQIMSSLSRQAPAAPAEADFEREVEDWEASQPFYDLAWRHGASQHLSFDGDELESLTFSVKDFENFCVALTPAAPTQALLGWTRYEKARKLNPAQWAELHQRNLRGENFDDMIDALPATTQPVQQAAPTPAEPYKAIMSLRECMEAEEPAPILDGSNTDNVAAFLHGAEPAKTEAEDQTVLSVAATLTRAGETPQDALVMAKAAVAALALDLDGHFKPDEISRMVEEVGGLQVAANVFQLTRDDLLRLVDALSTPPTPEAEPAQQDTDLKDFKRIMSMPEAQVDAELRAHGIDPEDAAQRAGKAIEAAHVEARQQAYRNGYEQGWGDRANGSQHAFLATPPAEKQAAPSGEALLLMMRAQAERMPDMTQAEAIRLIDMALQDAKGAAS